MVLKSGQINGNRESANTPYGYQDSRESQRLSDKSISYSYNFVQ